MDIELVYHQGQEHRSRKWQQQMQQPPFLENRLLSFIFKNNAASFSSPGDKIYVGLATAVSNFNDSTGESGDPTITEATFTNYARVQVTASNWTLTAESADTQTNKKCRKHRICSLLVDK